MLTPVSPCFIRHIYVRINDSFSPTDGFKTSSEGRSRHERRDTSRTSGEPGCNW